ncbi:NUMOD4 motif-containing HNH endonuclease [uncultured Microbacterium sp.]|uniref:NUMOD4 motif-containing HNH endonuclease n=1 Tax=uncultured Microbacterium sp. TaxID=191216 RepID=UPI0037DD3B27
MTNESSIWKPVVGYEGAYEVSDTGQVRSLDRLVTYSDGRIVKYKGRVIRQKFGHNYMRVGLSLAGRTDSWCVHRLVADAFHEPKPNPQAVVRHLNGDHLNNRAENLRWGTAAENSADMVAHGRSRASQTHCHRGHEFTPENTREYRGRRVCRSCQRNTDDTKRWRRRSRFGRTGHPATCRVCGCDFKAGYGAAFCSKNCKAQSRRVAWIRGESQRRSAA